MEIDRPNDPMRPEKVDVWSLFHSQFKIGDDVVIIDEDDDVLIGKLVGYTEEHCIIKMRRERIIPWVEIRFMSHDGFPCKKLMGADGSKLIEKIDTRDLRGALREALTFTVSRSGRLQDVPRLDEAVFGDPFLIEGVSAQLFNVGNDSPLFWSDGPGYLWEEVICLEAGDGAQAQLFGLDTIYYSKAG